MFYIRQGNIPNKRHIQHRDKDGSLFFDGDDYVEIPHNASLNINDNNGNQCQLPADYKQ